MYLRILTYVSIYIHTYYMYIHKHNNYCITYNINMQTHKFMYSVTVVHKKTAALDTHGITI